MFWTKFVKSIAKIVLVFMLIATFIAFIAAVRNSVFVGLVVLVLGVIGSFLSVSGIMLVCEMSENIGAIKNHLTGTTDTANSFSINDIAQNLGVNMPQNNVQPQANAEENKVNLDK